MVGKSIPPAEAAAVHEAVVVTCSNRSAAGERDDTAGPALVEALRAAGWDPEADAVVVPDDETAIAAAIATLADAGHRLILTTGGTGLTPTDVPPAATLRVADREVPGIAEMMRAAGLASTPWPRCPRGGGGASHHPDREPARLPQGRPRVAERGSAGAAARDRATGRWRPLRRA